MVCPKCGTEYKCPCVHCSERETPSVKRLDNDIQQCLICGFTRGIDWFYSRQEPGRTEKLFQRYKRLFGKREEYL